MCQFLHQPCSVDSGAVSALKALGGLPFCLTNVPQSMYSLQCSNPAYGVTGNAWDPDREAGGSSGGEGSLIGKFQSALRTLSFHIATSIQKRALLFQSAKKLSSAPEEAEN